MPKPRKKKEQEKLLLKLERECNELYRARREKGGHWVSVKPYHRGWFQSFTLREDAKNRSDAGAMLQALSLVNTTIYSHRKDFKFKDWKTGTWRDIEHHTRCLTVRQYENLGEKLQSLFVKGIRTTNLGRIQEGYFLKNPFYYVKHVYPAIVTEEWKPDADYDSHLAEINAKMKHLNAWPKLSRLHGHKNHRGRNEYHSKKFKFLNGDIFDVFEEEDE